MSRFIKSTIVVMSLALAGPALAATATPHMATATRIAANDKECISLRHQYDAAIKGRADTPTGKTAASLASQGHLACNSVSYSKGVADYEAALKTLGVTPTA